MLSVFPDEVISYIDRASIDASKRIENAFAWVMKVGKNYCKQNDIKLNWALMYRRLRQAGFPAKMSNSQDDDLYRQYPKRDVRLPMDSTTKLLEDSKIRFTRKSSRRNYYARQKNKRKNMGNIVRFPESIRKIRFMKLTKLQKARLSAFPDKVIKESIREWAMCVDSTDPFNCFYGLCMKYCKNWNMQPNWKFSKELYDKLLSAEEKDEQVSSSCEKQQNTAIVEQQTVGEVVTGDMLERMKKVINDPKIIKFCKQLGVEPIKHFRFDRFIKEEDV